MKEQGRALGIYQGLQSHPPERRQDTGDQRQRHWYDRPHETLVAEIRSAVAQARAEAEKNKQPFDAVKWVGLQLTSTLWRASGDAHRNRLDTSLVWDAISHPYIQDQEYKSAVESVLLTGTAQRRSNIVSLDPEAGKLIDVMADAVRVPHTRGQRTFDLLTDPQKVLFRQIHTRIARENRI